MLLAFEIPPFIPEPQTNDRKPMTLLKTFVLISLLQFTYAVPGVHAQTNEGLTPEAMSSGLQFSQDNNLAFLEAIEFCLDQIGSPVTFDENTQNTMLAQFRQAFPTLPLEVQFRLSHAREILTIYQTTWDYIGIDEKKEFAFDILSLAFGEAAATQALGLTETPQEQSYDEVMDDFCIHNPGVCP